MVDFHTDLSAVKPLLEDQIRYNLAIAEEGIKKGYGAQVGPSLLAKAKKKPLDRSI